MNKTAIAVFAAIGAVTAWTIWDNFRLTVSEYDLYSSELPAGFDGFTIAQASDLHNAKFGAEQKTLLRAIRSAKPDMTAITGDLFHTARRKNAYAFLKAVTSYAPCFYVSGNHEQRFADYFSEIVPTLENLGAQVLDDRRVTITRGGDTISVIGLSDPTFRATIPPAELTDKKLSALECGGFTILLTHRPELFDVYRKHNISLALAGHAHGGQVRFRHKGLFAVHQGWFPKYTEGIFTENITNPTESGSSQCTMAVSRGLGNSTLYPKINNPPELVILRLHRKAD